MGWSLGVDVGTTWTSAAICRDGHCEVVPLADHGADLPTVVAMGHAQEGLLLVGSAAERKGMTDPSSMAREFKRRLGDPTPILLSGVPYSAHALTATVLRWVVDQVGRRMGGPPDVVVATYPANWGSYKRELFAQALSMADLPGAHLCSEPEAAAIQYASLRRLEPGQTVAVYDLGGGTFDAAVLRCGADGFELLGTPGGIEQLGGVDIDDAVFHWVIRSLGAEVGQLDRDDVATVSGLNRLRAECTAAKEALSYDPEVRVPVALPALHTEVRLTRAELEDLIRPSLLDTVAALRRALDSAGVAQHELHAVLLAGGSSRIPLVRELLSGELGCPVVSDAHPKHLVALGAARFGSAAVAGASPLAPPPEPGAEPGPRSTGAATTAATAAAVGGRRVDALSAGIAVAAVAILLVTLISSPDAPTQAASTADGSPAATSTSPSPAQSPSPSPSPSPEATLTDDNLPRSATPLPPDSMLLTSTSGGRFFLGTVVAAPDAVPKPLTPALDPDEWLPALSPDRRTVAYIQREGDTDGVLHLMSADGAVDVATETHLAPANRVAWAPDGTRLAFVTPPGLEPNSGSDLVIADLDATTNPPSLGPPRGVLPDGLVQGDISWSPDGTRIAYWGRAVDEPDSSVEIFVVDIEDGGGIERVTTNADVEQDPAWSPDSKSLVFTRVRPNNGGNDLYVVELSSGEEERPLVGGDGSFNQDPAWSPDGLWIAFARGREPTSHLWRVREDGTEEEQLTSGDAGEGHASWGVAGAQQ